MAQLSIAVKTNNGTFAITNFESIKNQIENEVRQYTTMVVTENDIDLAKSILAKCNKISKIINDHRISEQKDFMQPFMQGKQQYDTLIEIINDAVLNLKTQCKTYEEKAKAEKYTEIETEWNKHEFTLIPLEKVFNPKWLNITYSISKIATDIEEIISKIKNDVNTLSSIASSENARWELIETYCNCLDLSLTIDGYKSHKERINLIKSIYLPEESQIAHREALLRVQIEPSKLIRLINYIKEECKAEVKLLDINKYKGGK